MIVSESLTVLGSTFQLKMEPASNQVSSYDYIKKIYLIYEKKQTTIENHKNIKD